MNRDQKSEVSSQRSETRGQGSAAIKGTATDKDIFHPDL